jgi:hypothetical protein
MEINSSTKAYAANLNTAAPVSNPAVESQKVAAQADKVTLSTESLALAAAATEPPGWPPIDEERAIKTEPPGWPPIDPPEPDEKG